MKITNPTGSDITVQIQGVVYTVEANGSLAEVPTEAAKYWKTMLHNFLTIEEDTAPMVVEAPAEDPKEEEIKEGVVEEKPVAKKTTAKKVTSKSKK